MQRNLLDFPLWSLTRGDELDDFRSVVRPRLVPLEPRFGELLSFDVSKDWPGNWRFLPAFAQGNVRNAPIYSVRNAPFVEQIYAQQLGDYRIAEVQLKKNFLDPALKIELIQSFLQNGQENMNETDSSTYRSDAIRWMTELNFLYGGMRSRWKINWFNKLSNYAFRNENIDGIPVQRMLSSTLNVEYELLLERLLASVGSRYVYFYDAQTATFQDLSASLEWINKTWRIYLLAGNLLNNKDFVMQDVNPLFISTDYRRVLPRYIKIGVRKTFN